MLKIKSLNRDSISDDDVPAIRKEAQEENALAKYNKALKLQCSGNYEEAESLLQSLLETDIPEIENRGGLPKTMSTLKYSCYLNMGTISTSLGKKQNALDYYANASELDKTDVTLWFKIGSLAVELDHFKQAAYALSKGLENNKNHWPSLDKLIMLLYAMRDTVSCLYYISRGLQLDPDYIRGLILRKRIYENNPAIKDYYQLYNPDYIYDPPLDIQFDEAEGKELEKESNEIFERIRALELDLEPKPLPVLPLSKPLEEFTWASLGQSIIHMHRYISEHKLSFICRVNLNESMKEDNNNENPQISEESEKIKPEEKLIPENEPNGEMLDEEKISDRNEKKEEKSTEMEICEPESNFVSEVPELPEAPSTDTETEVDKEDKPFNENETENDEEISNQNSKSNSQDQDQDCETDTKKECESTEQKEGEKSGSENGNNEKSENKIENASEEKSKSKTPNRRRRNSLSFLQPWAWHSKRKSSRKMGKNDKDDTIEGALRRIIPNNILPKGLKCDKYKEMGVLQLDDSVNTMDLYKLFVDEHDQITDSPLHNIDFSEYEKYFGSHEEKEDIELFWNYKFERCDIISLIEKYIKTLATKWIYKWPELLKSIYVDIYEMYRNFYDHPQVFCDKVDFETLKTDTEITLIYSELIFDCVQDCINNNLPLADIKHLPSTSLSTMELVCTRKTDWGDRFLNMNMRLNWLKANIYMAENKNEQAIRALNALMYYITHIAKSENDYYLKLPNCAYNTLITKRNTEKLLQSLEMLQKLGYVEKLYENKSYKEVIKILKETFELKHIFKFKTKIDRPVQIVMLLHALWLTDRTECLIWCDVCLNESLPMYFKTYAQPDSFEHKRWSLVVVKCMVLMEACIKEENIIILDSIKENQTRVVENLTSIICHQLNSKSLDNNSKMPLETVKPWILLHYILQREEHRIQAKRSVRHCKNSDESDEEPNVSSTTKSEDSEEDDEQDVPASVQILFSAHEFLGRRGWCLENSGEILLFLVEVILYRLNAPIFEGIREKIDIHLEQAFFCLYQHPSKKNKVSRHLADHNVDPLSLTWDHAQQLYEFYQPKALPEFDSYRYSSISNEMEQLLLRILNLVPTDYDPQSRLGRVSEFVNGREDIMPESIAFPHKVSAIYYLLGDYYLKLHDPSKALKYFLLDLCINPTRLDTWADMALGMASQLETKLNHCEAFKHEAEFLDKVRSAQICFKQSLQISNGHSMLWIEYGNFVYMAHSFCSRLLKGDTDMFSMEKFETLESQKEALLDTAMECFSAASIAWQAEPGEHDERWLHHYMLAKVAEKKKQDPATYLDHYNKASKLLFENKATYPLKINYSNPQHLSMEALEIHYRIHASILKYLELHEDKPISRTVGKIFQKYLKESDNGLFSKSVQRPETKPYSESLKRPANESDQPASKKRRTTVDDVDTDVANILEEILKKVEAEEKNDDIVMIIDSDEDANTKQKTPPETVSTLASSETAKFPRIRVKNAQEIMDDMMKKCMANQPDYKDETDESEADKLNDSNKTLTPENIPQKPIAESASSPSRRGSTTSTAATTTTTTSTSDSSDSSSSDDSDSSSSDSESDETESSKQSNVSGKKNNDSPLTAEETKKLIEQCLLALEQCISRFPQNYKALYRLTHFYLNNKTFRNLTKCRQLMLTEYTCADMSIVTGLFSDRKNNNFFNGVWRIPTSEIDRPGSFASHMSRCVELLMKVLRDSDDHKTLLDLCLLLRRTPDPDKIYIRDSERQQLADQALSICIQSLRGMIKKYIAGKKIYNELEFTEIDSNIKLIMDIYKSYQKVQKHLPHKETVFTNLLIEVYKHYMQNKLPEGTNMLESAIKFCQQRKMTARLTLTPQTPTNISVSKLATTPQNSIPQSPTMTTTPVNPLKRSAKSFPGRPRGRPPNINKHLSGSKPPKQTSSATNQSFYPSTTTANPFASWQSLLYSSSIDPKLALNYMMTEYQKQLMRQYSQLGPNAFGTNPFGTNPLSVLPTTAQAGEKDKQPVASTSKSAEGKTKSDKRDKNETNIRYSKESNKAYYAEPNKDFTGDINIFKDRPGISITPIHQNTVPVIPKPANIHIPTSPGKTLQQKLAERQKQNPAAQQQKTQNIPQQKPQKTSSSKSTSKHESSALDYYNQYQNFTQKNVFTKPSIPLPPVPHSSKMLGKLPSYKNLQKNIPSSLTITKSQPQNLMQGIQTGDSGISISQIPQMYKQADTTKLMSFRKPSASAPKLKLGSRKLGSDITVTPNYKPSEPKKDMNLPMSLSISKKDESGKKEAKKDDDVEIITIE